MAALTRSMNLFLQAEERPTSTNVLTMVTHGTAGSGVFRGLTLHTYADENANQLTASLPLTVWHNTSETLENSLNLSLTGEVWRVSQGLEMVLWADKGVANSLPLFTQGSGTTEGAYPLEKSLNLHLERNPAAILTLFVQGPGTPGSGSIPLYTQGALGLDGSLDLSIPNVLGLVTEPLTLYTHGF